MISEIAFAAGNESSSLAALLITRAAETPDWMGWHYLVEGEVHGEIQTMTWGELRDRATGVAQALNTHASQQDRIILIFPPGLDFIVAFYACQLAGMVAVPVPPPEPEKLASSLPRLVAIVKDAAPKVVLSVTMVRDIAQELVPEMAALPWIATDEVAASKEVLPCPSSEGNSFIQYTSGSTGTPKGVMISHANIMANLEMIHQSMAFDALADELPIRPSIQNPFTAVSWLPTFHDMGLIGYVLQPLYSRALVALMSPLDFLRRPARWLEAIHHYRAVISGGPNFAYALAQKRVEPALRRRLDLSCWKRAFSGAEPVRAQSLQDFANTFKECGFHSKSWYPTYGLAEATVQVSGGPPLGLEVRRFRGLDRGQALPGGLLDTALVACGAPVPNSVVRIVNPQGQALEDGAIGEIYVRGPHVSEGYFGRPEDPTFQGKVKGEEGYFLKTGDLGFLFAGQLYIAGRIKDLIVVRGRNHYPQDIELTVERAHPAIRLGGQVALSIDDGREERLLVLCEVDPRGPHREVVGAIREALLRVHGLDGEIVLIEPKSIPRTSSGKIQRQQSKTLWRDGALPVVKGVETPVAEPLASVKDDSDLRPEDIRAWMVAWIQNRVRPGVVQEGAPLAAAGLDSLMVVQISADLEAWLGFEVPPELLFGTPIRRIAALLAHGQRQLGMGRPKDLLGDAELPPDLQIVQQSPGSEILLTGATGFLGTFLLQELIKQQESPIVCIVRAHDDAAALARLHRAAEIFGLHLPEGRVRAVAGDLAQPAFGLSPEEFEALGAGLKAIYHSGAEIHWGRGYSSLKKVNVGGTLEILRLAALRGAAIHHVSSIGVFPIAEDTRAEFPEDARVEEGEKLRLGYFQSKWVAERMVENAKARGFNVTIYRPGFISGLSSTGQELASESQLFYAFLAGIIQMTEAPAVEKVMDLVPVDWVATAIVRLSKDERALGHRFNMVNARPLRQRHLYQMLQKQGYVLKELAWPRWREQVLQGKSDNPLGRFAIYYRLLTEARMARLEVQMAERMPVETLQSTRLLGEYGLDCPAFDEKLVRTYLQWYQQQGLLPLPPAPQVVASAPTQAQWPTPIWVDPLQMQEDRLIQLYNRGKEKQWDGAKRIDWSIPLDPENPQDLPDITLPLYGSDMYRRMTPTERGAARRHFQAWQLSQFMHGEQGALLCAARIVQQAPTIEGRLYAATQVMDESRHLEVFGRMLREKFELSYPATAPLKQLLDQVLSDSRWDMTCLGMQVLIEGLALAAFGAIRDQSKNRLAVQVNAYVMEDEARHVAFGHRLLAPYYASISDAERREREEFVVEASYLLRDRFQALDVWEALGLPAGACAAWLRESGFQRAWRGELFSRIVPIIRAIGLWGEPVQRAYAQMGVLGFAENDLEASYAADEAAAARLEAFV